jgi:hypothetical protein
LTKRSPQPRLPKKRRRPEESPRKGRRKSRFELRTSNLELRRSQIPHALVLRRVRIMVCSRCNQAAGDYWYSSASSAPPSAQVRPRCSPRALPAAACMQSSPIRAYLSTVRTVRSRESRIHKEVDLFSVRQRTPCVSPACSQELHSHVTLLSPTAARDRTQARSACGRGRQQPPLLSVPLRDQGQQLHHVMRWPEPLRCFAAGAGSG